MGLDIGFASQTPALPGNGGGMAGLGETFTPDLSTGTGTMAVPLDLPNGPNDICPKLTLRYDSSAPNGVFGVGWSLPLPRLMRSTMRGAPRGDESDQLVLEGSGPLVRGAGGVLRPEVESGDWRVVVDGPGFLVTDRAGTHYELGTTADSRIPGAGGTTWSWLLHAIEDNLGNRAELTWRSDGSQRYLETLTYGPFEVALDYETRPDVLRFGRAGFVLVTDQRCRSVELRIAGDAQPVVRRWTFGYERADPSGASLLRSVVLTGVGADGSTVDAPPLTFGYAVPARARLHRVEAHDAAAPPALRDDGRVELIDWFGDGLPSVVEFGSGGTARVWPNLAGRWGRPVAAGLVPQLAGSAARAGVIDLDGDGVADAVRIDRPLDGYQPRRGDVFERPVAWRTAPGVALMSPTCRLADLDGDGMVDFMWSTGRSVLLAERTDDGWAERPVVVPARADGLPTDLADPHVRIADMTGDGTPDLVRVDGRGVTYWPYLGSGVFGDAVSMLAPPVLPFDARPDDMHLVDLDGDGCADVIHIADGRVRWWPNRSGCGFEPPRDVPHVPTGALRQIRAADVLGTSVPAICWTAAQADGRGRWFALDVMGSIRPGVMTTVDNGIGRRTTIAYSTSAHESARDRAAGREWQARLPIVLPVVSGISVRDQTTGRTTATEIRYHDGRYDGVLREVCGFGEVEVTDVGDDDVETLHTVRRFEVGLRSDGNEPATERERSRARAIRGRITRVERRGADGRVLDRADTEWIVTDSADGLTVVPRLVRTSRSVFEGAMSPVSRVVTEQLAWDADGNVTEARERTFAGAASTPSGELRTLTDYAVDPTGRYRQRPWRIRQLDSAGRLLAETRTAYDDTPDGRIGAAGLVTGRTALAITDEIALAVYGGDQPDFAALGYTRRAGVDGWWVELGRYARTVDANGVHGVITGARGGVSELHLDRHGCYPVRARDALGHELTATFDLRSYQATSITDPSGATSTARFDPLARLLAVVEPGDTDGDPTVAYRYDTASTPITVTVSRATQPGAPRRVERDVLDGDGRLIERRRPHGPGELIEVANEYGARGLLVRSYLPRMATSPTHLAPAVTDAHASIAYDALGRAVRTTRPDGAVASVRYLPGAIEETDEAGHVVRRVLDASGRAVRTEQLPGPSPVVTTDTFDLKGSVVEHVDAEGASTRFTYDLLGRVLRVARPESTQLAVLDPAGNTVESRNAAARVRRTFDIGDRLVAVGHGAAGGPAVTTLTYHDGAAPPDAGAHTAGGRLVRVDDESGTTIFDYDERGRITSKTMRPVGAPETTILTAYRSDGLVASITYPGGTTVAYGYDDHGRLLTVGGVIDAIEYDLRGRRTLTRYANGVEEHDQHDVSTGWPTAARIVGPGGVLRDVGYQHDAIGNLTGLASPDPARAWTYRYDALSQLVEATGAAGTWTYEYDRAGNMTSSSALGAYVYGDGGAPATCLTSAGPDVYTYDDRGHVSSAPWGAHSVDAEGRLRRIDLAGGGHEEMTYGHGGRLVRRRQVAAGGAATDVIAPDRLVRFEDGTLVLQFTDGDRVVARDSGGERTWLHTDHLGSVVLGTSSTGVVVLSITYGPFGTVLARNGEAVPQGFGTGEAMGAGLVLLGARWYSPRLGRFLSPDPIVADASDPLAWNAYAYARNNPTSYIDPSGRSFWKIFGAVLATIAIIALVVVVSVFTFGIASPGAVALGVGGISVTWGAVFAATMIGVVAGGVIGGIAAARAGGDAGDIALGVLVGGAVGGWAAFGAAFAGVAVAGGLGLTAGGVGAGAVAGGVSGAINGAAMGFASGFAGGRNNGFKDIMEKVLIGAIIGAAIGAALGALSGIQAPKESVRDSIEKSLTPQTPSSQPPAIPSNAPTQPPAPVNSFGDAMSSVGGKLAGKVAGAVVPHAAAATSGFTGSIITQTVLVDLTAAGATAFWDDLQDYLRTHDVKLGPFDFIKGDF